jgi:hypothetical protein
MSSLFDDVSRLIASPVSRRKMLGMLGTAFGGAMLAAFGIQPAALAQAAPEKCLKGQTACHGKCCDAGFICCGAKCCTSKRAVCQSSFCCESGIVCAGKCCNENQVCDKGRCVREISPDKP